MRETTVGGMRLRVTDWFGPSSRPGREGVYERLSPGGPFTCWNGRAWNADAHSPADAAKQTGISAHQAAAWRGIVQQVDAPCATCRGHTVIDRGHDPDTGDDLIAECPDC